MEEILASIRKIISEDEEEPPAEEDESAAEDVAEVEEAAAEEVVEEAPEEVPEEMPEETPEEMPEEPPAEPPEEAGDAEEEVLELTQMVNEDGTVVDLTETSEEEAPEEPPPSTEALELVDEIEPEPEPEPEPLPPLEPEEPLISPPVAATSTEAFANLADALVREKLIEGRTVEDLIKEILRPLLKQWLDDNLSGLVKEEIEKLSERARNL